MYIHTATADFPFKGSIRKEEREVERESERKKEGERESETKKVEV
jgi:hypothetical protein